MMTTDISGKGSAGMFIIMKPLSVLRAVEAAVTAVAEAAAEPDLS